MFVKSYEEKITIVVKDDKITDDLDEGQALDLANKEMVDKGHDIQFLDIESFHSHYNEVTVVYTK